MHSRNMAFGRGDEGEGVAWLARCIGYFISGVGEGLLDCVLGIGIKEGIDFVTALCHFICGEVRDLASAGKGGVEVGRVVLGAFAVDFDFVDAGKFVFVL